MSSVTRKAWHCDACTHEWLIQDETKPPIWCAKCRSRKWNAVVKTATVEQVVADHKPGLDDLARTDMFESEKSAEAKHDRYARPTYSQSFFKK